LLNLGVPYLVFSAVYIAINSFVGEANNHSSITDILFIWKTPIAQYWFLYALFFLFCIWALLSGVLKNWQITVLTLVIGYGVPLLGKTLGCFEVVFYSSLAFGLGTFISFDKLTKVKAWVKWLIVLLHLAFGAAFVSLDLIEAPFVKEFMLLLGIYASILFISVLQKIKPISKFLEFVNKYSFQIYLLHTIFTAGTRIVLLRLGITEWWIHVIVGTLFGLTFSVLAAMIAKKVGFLNFLFFPTKSLKKKERYENE
jgi:peptidoglycan/LPS O-acetylase OafA/YrhL